MLFAFAEGDDECRVADNFYPALFRLVPVDIQALFHIRLETVADLAVGFYDVFFFGRCFRVGGGFGNASVIGVNLESVVVAAKGDKREHVAWKSRSAFLIILVIVVGLLFRLRLVVGKIQEACFALHAFDDDDIVLGYLVAKLCELAIDRHFLLFDKGVSAAAGSVPLVGYVLVYPHGEYWFFHKCSSIAHFLFLLHNFYISPTICRDRGFSVFVIRKEIVMITVSRLWRYPLKSAAGQEINSADVARQGFLYDRQLMVVDLQGKFITLRQCAALSLIRAEVVGGVAHLRAPRMPEMSVELYHLQGEEIRVEVHGKETFPALDQGDLHAEWLSDFLGRDCCLVAIPEHHLRNRMVNEKQMTLACQDSSPIHVVTQPSLFELRCRILEQSNHAYSDVELDGFVDPRRFRPNILLKGDFAPRKEEQWPLLQFRSGLVLAPWKRTPRCGIVTVDPDTGARQEEPLATLKAYYDTSDQGPLFGMYYIPTVDGRIFVGEEVEAE